ncbi:MAG: hypothetical protein U0T82_00885 [Bacteroidales bacterium]
MKKFLFKMLLFLVPVTGIFWYMESELAKLPNSYMLKKDYFEKNIDRTEVLILGSSHAMNDVNPEFISKPAFNLANASQSLYYDSRLCLNYLDRMKSLQTVVITVSYFSLWMQLSDTRESWRDYFYYKFWGISEREFPWYDIRKYSYTMLYGPSTSLKYLTGFSRDESELRMSDLGWVRKDVLNPNPNLSAEAGAAKVEADNRTMHASELERNVKILEDFTGELRRHNIRVLFLSTPLYVEYRRFTDPEMNRITKMTIRDICKRYACKWVDFTEDSRFTAADFNDNEHLNIAGAEKLSRMLDEEIQAEDNQQLPADNPPLLKKIPEP